MAYLTASVPSPNRYDGRTAAPRVIVLHTIECPCATGQARNAAAYLANPSVQASCHWAVDPGWRVQQVDEADTAWAAPGANADGIQIEQAGRAAFGAADWARPEAQAMLRVTAQVMADASKRWGIPLRHLSNAELAAGQRGVVGHVQVSEVYRKSDHWDPGPAYPYDLVVGWANELAGTTSAAGTVQPAKPTAPTTTTPEEEDMAQPAKLFRVDGTSPVYAVPFPYYIWVPDQDALWAWRQAGLVTTDEPIVVPNATMFRDLIQVGKVPPQ